MTETRSAGSDGGYSPISRLEDRSERVADLLALLLVLAGLFVLGGHPASVAGVLLVGLWLYLHVEFVFAAGIVVIAGLGGQPTAVGTVLAITGLAGLLAVALSRTWQSVVPVVLFLTLFAVVGGSLLLSHPVAARWLAAGAAVATAGAAYWLHRYERDGLRAVDAHDDDDGDRRESTPSVDDTSGAGDAHARNRRGNDVTGRRQGDRDR
jgi:hypothetical protein